MSHSAIEKRPTINSTRYPVIDPEETRKHLHTLIIDKKLTAQSIQEYMNLSTVRTVYKWYQSFGSLPCLDHFYALSVLLGVSINDIIIEKQQGSQNNFAPTDYRKDDSNQS